MEDILSKQRLPFLILFVINELIHQSCKYLCLSKLINELIVSPLVVLIICLIVVELSCNIITFLYHSFKFLVRYFAFVEIYHLLQFFNYVSAHYVSNYFLDLLYFLIDIFFLDFFQCPKQITEIAGFWIINWMILVN